LEGRRRADRVLVGKLKDSHLEDIEVDGMITINGPSRTEMEGCSLV
jgi:hypothetical protein